MKIDYIYKKNNGEYSVDMDTEMLTRVYEFIRSELAEATESKDRKDAVDLARSFIIVSEKVDADEID